MTNGKRGTWPDEISVGVFLTAEEHALLLHGTTLFLSDAFKHRLSQVREADRRRLMVASGEEWRIVLGCIEYTCNTFSDRDRHRRFMRLTRKVEKACTHTCRNH